MASSKLIDLTSSSDSRSQSDRMNDVTGTAAVKQEKRQVVAENRQEANNRLRSKSRSRLPGSIPARENAKVPPHNSSRAATYDNNPRPPGEPRKVTANDANSSAQSRHAHSANAKFIPRSKEQLNRDRTHYLHGATSTHSAKLAFDSQSRESHTAPQSGSRNEAKVNSSRLQQSGSGDSLTQGLKRARAEGSSELSAMIKKRRFDAQPYMSKKLTVKSYPPLTAERPETKQNLKRSYLDKNVIDLTDATDVPELIVIDDDDDNNTQASINNASTFRKLVDSTSKNIAPKISNHGTTRALGTTPTLASRTKDSASLTAQTGDRVKTEDAPVPSSEPHTEHLVQLGQSLPQRNGLAVPARITKQVTLQRHAHSPGHSNTAHSSLVGVGLRDQDASLGQSPGKPLEQSDACVQRAQSRSPAASQSNIPSEANSLSSQPEGALPNSLAISQHTGEDIHNTHADDAESVHGVTSKKDALGDIVGAKLMSRSDIVSADDFETQQSQTASRDRLAALFRTHMQDSREVCEQLIVLINSSSSQQKGSYDLNIAIPPALHATDRQSSRRLIGSTADTSVPAADIASDKSSWKVGDAAAEASHVLYLLQDLPIQPAFKTIIEYACMHEHRTQLFPGMIEYFEQRAELKDTSANLQKSGVQKYGDKEWQRIMSKLGINQSDKREKQLAASDETRETPPTPRQPIVNETPSPNQCSKTQKLPGQIPAQDLNTAVHTLDDAPALPISQNRNMSTLDLNIDTTEISTELYGSNEVERALGRHLQELSNDSEYWTRALLKRARCQRGHPTASSNSSSSSNPFSFSAMRAIQTSSAPARTSGQVAVLNIECASTKKKLAFTCPVTAYSVRDTMPAFSHYVEIKRNFLSLNEKTMVSWPYFGDDYNEINREKGHDPEREIGEVYSLDILSRPQKLLHMLQSQRYDPYIESALTDLRLSWTDLLHFALDLAPDVGTSIEARRALKQRDNYCEGEISRQNSRTAIVLSSIPNSDSGKIALAALFFENFQKMTGNSLWHVVRRHMYDRVAEGSSDCDKQARLDKFTCRVCLRLQCPYHGEIQEVDEHDGAASDNASTESAYMDIINPKVINSRERIEFRPALSQSLPQTSVDNAPVKARQTVQYLIQRNLVNEVNSAGPFYPCHHPGKSCDDAQCTCFESRILCEKTCSCASDCPRKFQGCSCSSEKRKKGQKMMCFDDDRCACLKTSRECDPDLCGACGVCDVLDPVHRHDPNILLGRCRNASVQRGVSKHTLVGKSLIAGLGLYTTEPIEQHEFVGEYKGEIISHDEAERRWTVYQHQGLHYIFSLNKAQEVDGTYFGNKTRFINHARPGKFNLYPKTITVNSVHRVALYAIRKIRPGEELFFDYGPMFPDELVGGKKNKKKVAARADNLKDYYDVEQTEDEHGTLHARKVTVTGHKEKSRTKHGNGRARYTKTVRIGDTDGEPAPQNILEDIEEDEENDDQDMPETNALVSSDAADAGNAGQRLYSYNISEEDEHDVTLDIPEPEEDDDFEPDVDLSDDEDEVEPDRDGGRSRYASREADRGGRHPFTRRTQTASTSPQKRAGR